VHPFAIQAGVDWANAQNAPYIIKEAALLFESGSAAGLDFIIGVDAPFDTRISRVIKRDGITKEDILDRMNHQIDVNLKMKRCDFVVLNNEMDLLIEQIILLDKKILAKTQ
jgi:dephospho-CoA kinase